MMNMYSNMSKHNSANEYAECDMMEYDINDT